MATKKTPVTDDAALPSFEDGGDLDQAIGDLRGVLKTDAEGSLSDFGDFGDFGSTDEVSTETDLSAFGGGGQYHFADAGTVDWREQLAAYDRQFALGQAQTL